MKVDINQYVISKEFIQKCYLEKGSQDASYSIALLAAVTFVPAIVVAFYVGEVANWPESVIDTIIRLKDFYEYKVIENVPESFPKKEIL